MSTSCRLPVGYAIVDLIIMVVLVLKKKEKGKNNKKTKTNKKDPFEQI